MQNYHINTTTNNVGKCSTTPERCPVSDVSNHYSTEQKAIEANEELLKQNHNTIQTLQKPKSQNGPKLSESIFEHPKGYEFYKSMNAADEKEQAKILRNFDYGTVKKSLILGENTAAMLTSIKTQIEEQKHSKDTMPVEYNVYAIEDANKTYSMYLTDEDDVFLAASHNVEARNGYNQTHTMYTNTK